MYQGSKTPHRPERCRSCVHDLQATTGNPGCILRNGQNMDTNKRGEPWKNWICPRYVPRREA